MLSHPEELFSEDAILELFRLLLSPTISESYTCVPRHLRRVHWNQGRGEAREPFRYFGKTLMTCGSIVCWKRSDMDWRASKLEEYLYFDSRCLRTSEIVKEQDLKRCAWVYLLLFTFITRAKSLGKVNSILPQGKVQELCFTKHVLVWSGQYDDHLSSLLPYVSIVYLVGCSVLQIVSHLGSGVV